MREIIYVLGVPFDTVTMEQAVEKVKGFLCEKRQHIVCTPNPEIVMEAQNDDKLMNILKSADLVVADGVGVVWASKYSEKKLTERVAGYDLVQKLFDEIKDTEHTVYFFGGAPGVSLAAAKKMEQKYPNLKIVGGHNGYFDEKEEKSSSKTKIFLASHVETEISSVDVSALRSLAHCVQVHTPVGLDHGVPGGKAGHICEAHMGKGVCRVRQLYQGVHGPAVPPDND